MLRSRWLPRVLWRWLFQQTSCPICLFRGSQRTLFLFAVFPCIVKWYHLNEFASCKIYLFLRFTIWRSHHHIFNITWFCKDTSAFHALPVLLPWLHRWTGQVSSTGTTRLTTLYFPLTKIKNLFRITQKNETD